LFMVFPTKAYRSVIQVVVDGTCRI